MLAEADVILVLDSDVPWIHATNRPSPAAAIYAVDIDPLKAGMSCGTYPRGASPPPDSKVAVEQIARFVRDNVLTDAGEVEARRVVITAARIRPGGPRSMPSSSPDADVIIAPVPDRVRARLLAGTDALVLTEAITSYQVVAEHLRPSRPGSVIPWRRRPGLGGRRRRRG